MKNSIVSRILLSVALILFLMPVVAYSSAFAATVATDRADYAPGEIVVITGSGWLPGETVTVLLHEEPIIDPAVDPDTWLEPSPVADSEGNLYDEFVVQPNDVGVTFTLTATGLSSGQIAQATFTDGNFKVQSNAADIVFELEHGVYRTTNCTGPYKTNGQNELHGFDEVGFSGGDVFTEGAGNSESIKFIASETSVDGGLFINWTDPDGNTLTSREICVQGFTGGGSRTYIANYSNCGNGTLDDGEQCDLGSSTNGQPGYCCSSTCTYVATGTECRASAGVCDLPETCTGSSAACPADAKSTAVCRLAADVCDVAESCNGVSNDCPADGYAAAGTVCRSAAGVCDVAEVCSGTSVACPTDGFKPSTEICRAAANICDATENCTGAAADCPEDLPAACSLVTSSSLCTFDIDPIADNQFRLILTPDHSLTPATAWKLNASNPGQFYYNILYLGAGQETVTITLPYPFVTQGAVPIHIYDDVAISTNNGTMCFTPGNELDNSPTLVALGDYGPGAVLGTSTTTIAVDLPSLPGGMAYINMHLDYGLKQTTGYSKNAGNDAVDATNLSTILVPEKQLYSFANTEAPGDTIQSENTFKRDPGIGGLVLQGGSSDPAPNVRVLIYDSAKKLVATVYTDQDGWYMWQYKYTGKAATFTIKLPDNNNNMTQSVTLKSNGFVVVNFTLP